MNVAVLHGSISLTMFTMLVILNSKCALLMLSVMETLLLIAEAKLSTGLSTAIKNPREATRSPRAGHDLKRSCDMMEGPLGRGLAGRDGVPFEGSLIVSQYLSDYIYSIIKYRFYDTETWRFFDDNYINVIADSIIVFFFLLFFYFFFFFKEMYPYRDVSCYP